MIAQLRDVLTSLLPARDVKRRPLDQELGRSELRPFGPALNESRP